MLTRERNLEASLEAALSDRLAKLEVEVVSIDHAETQNIIHLRLQLPDWADRHLRHDVLELLAEFERGLDHAVVTDPMFLWGPDSDD